jgi:hypothetical protein
MSYSPLGIWKNSKAGVCIAFVLLAPLSAGADGLADALGPSGSIRSAYWEKDKSFSEKDGYVVGAVWLNLRPQEVLGTRFYFEGFLQDQNLTRKGNKTVAEVREAYLERSFDRLDVRVGRQIIVWGRADKANPTDVLANKNLTLLSADDDDQRRGQFATQFAYNFEKFRVLAVWQSEWRQTDFALPPVSGVSLEQLRPNDGQNQYALKIDTSGGSFDGSVIYFSGFNRTPDFVVQAMGNPLRLGFNYNRIEVIGADFAKAVGNYGVRAEVAHTRTEDYGGTDPLRQNSFWSAVVGADRTLIENFNINVQALYLRVDDFVDPGFISDPNSRTLGLTLARISNQKYAEQMGLTLRPSYKMLNDTLEMELALVSWAKNGDSLIRPKITYAINDHVKALVGGEFYGGPRDSFFGQLKDTSSVFTELRWLF